MSWTVTFYHADVESEILDLPAGLLARFVRYAERMEEHSKARLDQSPEAAVPIGNCLPAFLAGLNGAEEIAKLFNGFQKYLCQAA